MRELSSLLKHHGSIPQFVSNSNSLIVSLDNISWTINNIYIHGGVFNATKLLKLLLCTKRETIDEKDNDNDDDDNNNNDAMFITRTCGSN